VKKKNAKIDRDIADKAWGYMWYTLPYYVQKSLFVQVENNNIARLNLYVR
jgi:hypothetical protein